MQENWDQVADRLSIISGVATRYAGALFDLAQESNALDSVYSDLGRLAQLIEESADLQRLIRSPAFSADEQLPAISAVLDAAGIGGLASSFVKVATTNRRLFIMPDVIHAFGELLARHRGEVSADVASAEPLSEKHVSDLKAALKASLGKDVNINASVDPSLIGGLVVKVGSRMIDGSLRTKLNSLKLAMKEVG